MFLHIVLCLLAVAVAFVVGEGLRRKHKLSNEVSRKLVHLLHGLTIIALAFAATKTFIICFELVFLSTVVAVRLGAARLLKVEWLYKVNRTSWGEFFYPFGVIAAVLLATNRWIFVAAMLQLAVTDSVAAIVGKVYGKSNGYKVFGTAKSVAGTAAFVLCALLVLAISLLPSHQLQGTAYLVLIWVPVPLAIVENLGINGSDNFLLPAACALLLSLAGA